MQLSSKQNEYITNANSRWNLKVGAVRSGKSYVDIAYTILRRLRERHGQAGLNLIIGVSRSTIERNVLEPMREIYTSRIVGSINAENIAIIGGEKVYCLGAEKRSQVAKIQGMSVKYAYGDEVAKWKQEVFTMLQSRLDKPYSCFDGSCNPEYPSHWLKEFIDKPDLDAYIQKYTLFDNPYLPDEFVDNLCREYAGTVFYDRLILGEWTLAEGLIYPMYQDALGVPPVNSYPAEYGISIDYGTRNAFAALLWEKHNNVWYATKGYYYSGRDTGINKTDEDYAHDMDLFVAPIVETLPVGRKIETIIDPSAASFITLLKKRSWCKCRDAVNNVLDGIRDTASCMQLGLIKVNPAIKEWVKEAGGYRWDDEHKIDAPVKEDDHYMDSTRYFVETKHLAVRKRLYTSTYLL